MVKKCFLLIIFLITFGVGLLSLESYALNDDPALKLYFTFDEGQGDTAKDHSQSKLKGKLTGNAKFIKDGKFGGHFPWKIQTVWFKYPHRTNLILPSPSLRQPTKVDIVCSRSVLVP